MQEVNTEELNTILNETKNVVVYISAKWCGPCKTFAPIMQKLSEEDKYKDVKFVKMDADECGALLQQHNSRSVPTILVVKDGKTTVVNGPKLAAVVEALA